jgi:predicted ArsR family transcriptional regulator
METIYNKVKKDWIYYFDGTHPYIPFPMPNVHKNEKTRRVLLTLLRARPSSVADLARETGLTVNAVRFHLESLELEGLVEPAGTRRPPGAGKPPILYAATAHADLVLSKAYAPMLSAVVKEVRRAVPANQIAAFFCRVGERMAAGAPESRGPLSRRVMAASRLLNALGGFTTVTRNGGGYRIQGRGCPLGVAVAQEPCVCSAVESLIEKVVGAPVTQCCDHSARPSCCFEIPAA